MRMVTGVILAIALFSGVAVAGSAPALKERMPDVSRAVMVGERETSCATASLVVKYYNTRGDGDVSVAGADLALYFAGSARKPFMAALWAPPDYSDLDRLLMDVNLNGYADIVGQVGDEAFGFSQCDALMYYLEHKR